MCACVCVCVLGVHLFNETPRSNPHEHTQTDIRTCASTDTHHCTRWNDRLYTHTHTYARRRMATTPSGYSCSTIETLHSNLRTKPAGACLCSANVELALNVTDCRALNRIRTLISRCFVLSWDLGLSTCTEVLVLFDILIANFWFTFPLPALMAVTMSIINSSLAKQGRQSKYSAWTEPKSQRYLQLCSLEKQNREVFRTRWIGAGDCAETETKSEFTWVPSTCYAWITKFVCSFIHVYYAHIQLFFFTYCQYIWLYICVQTVSNLTDKEFVWILPPYTSCFTHNHRSEIYTLAEYISFQQEKQTKLGNNK